MGNKNTPRISKYNTATGQIMASTSNVQRRLFDEELNHWSGGIPAFTSSGQRLLLYIGIIDILQHYKLFKKMEHHLKSIIYDGDTVSVHKPSFYKMRFETFMNTAVFMKKKKGSYIRSMPNLKQNANQMSSLPRHIIHQSQNIHPSPHHQPQPPIIQVEQARSNNLNNSTVNSSITKQHSQPLAGSSVKTMTYSIKSNSKLTSENVQTT